MMMNPSQRPVRSRNSIVAFEWLLVGSSGRQTHSISIFTWNALKPGRRVLEERCRRETPYRFVCRVNIDQVREIGRHEPDHFADAIGKLSEWLVQIVLQLIQCAMIHGKLHVTAFILRLLTGQHLIVDEKTIPSTYNGFVHNGSWISRLSGAFSEWKCGLLVVGNSHRRLTPERGSRQKLRIGTQITSRSLCLRVG